MSIDTLAANHLSTYGYERTTSPALSRFAKDAIVFENAIAPAPWTFPSYASQFTSRSSTAVMERGARVPESEMLLAEYMKVAGYVTAGFVDNGYLHSIHGLAQGYDHYREHDNSRGRSLREALAWIDAHRREPFFLFVHTNDVHGPYIPRPPFRTLFDQDRFWKGNKTVPILDTPQSHVFGALPRYQVQQSRQDLDFYVARYDAAIRQTDFWFEQLLRKLRNLDDWKDTLVIFSADHGESFGNHQFYLNHGLVYEDIIRVPLVLRLPGGKHGGKRIRTQVGLIDLLPTLLELTKTSARQPITGQSLLPLLRDARKQQSPYLFASQGIFEQFMVRTDRYKLIRFEPSAADQDQSWKTFPRDPRPKRGELVYELYDLQDDPDEHRNLVTSKPNVFRQLKSVMERAIEAGPDFRTESFEFDEAHRQRLRELGYVE